jgi:hypothetical protein
MSILLRRAFITVPPLVLAGVLLMHPNDEGDTIYESVRPVVDNWILVHIALLLAFPFLVLAAFMLLGGLVGRAATVARVALVFFAVIYTAWEVMVGLSTGILTDYANGLPAGEQAAVAGAIQDFNEHWVTQVALIVGFAGWVVAMVATAIAARGAGARWPAVALLGLASAFVIHPPPIGPVALSCFAAGALLLERARGAAARTDVRAGFAEVPPAAATSPESTPASRQ